MRERRIIVLLALVATVLAGCTVPPAFPDLDREAGPDDTLSEDFAATYGDQLEKIDPESVRLVAHDRDVDLYLMRTLNGGICLRLSGTETESMLACSSTAGSFGASSPVGTYQVRVAPMVEEEGWRILSHNVRVRVKASDSLPEEPEQELAPWESTARAVDDAGARPGATGEVSGEGTEAMAYVVADGDTASDIAERFGVGLEQLIDQAGQRLGDYPTLTPGDTIQFGAPLTGDDYDCFFGLAEPHAAGESCYE